MSLLLKSPNSLSTAKLFTTAALFTSAMLGLGALSACTSHDKSDSNEAKEMKEGDEAKEGKEAGEGKEADEGKGAAALAKAPQAVQDAVKQVVGKHKISECDSEQDNGKTVYEVDYKVHGTEYSVSVSEAGEVIEHEVTVDPSAVPPAVLDAATKTHPTGKVGEIDITSAGGKLFYEFDIKAPDNKYEMQVAADGSVLADAVDKD
jgi:uncharacterized membrane protein YkoI